jgi:hypothetical protein
MAFGEKGHQQILQITQVKSSSLCYRFESLISLMKMFVFIRYNIQKTDIGLIASVGVGFCDKKDTENCVVYVSLLANVVMPLPICKADGTLTWPQGMLLLEYEMGFYL